MFELNFLKSVKTGDGTKQFSGDDLCNCLDPGVYIEFFLSFFPKSF